MLITESWLGFINPICKVTSGQFVIETQALTPEDSFAFSFIRRLQSCRDKKSFADDLAKSLDWFGFEHASISRMPTPSEKLRQNVVFSTYPSDWRFEYHTKEFEKIDPILRYLRQGYEPKLWSDVPVEKGSSSWRVMRQAREYGLHFGISIPIITGRGVRAQATFCTSRPDFRKEGLASLGLVGIYSHYCIQSIREREEQRAAPELTPREMECFRFMIDGKSQSDTAQILAIAPRTVKFHLHSVARKLGTRAVPAQMIAEAYRHSLLS